MPRRPLVINRLGVGDLVVRRHRLLKTQGTVVRFDGDTGTCSARVWIKWSHPTTLPNPSLEYADDLERVGEADSARVG